MTAPDPEPAPPVLETYIIAGVKRRATEKNYAQMLSERFHETEKFAKEWKLTRGFD